LRKEFDESMQIQFSYKSEIDSLKLRLAQCEAKIEQQSANIIISNQKIDNNHKKQSPDPELQKNIVIHGLKEATEDPNKWFKNFCENNLETKIDAEEVNFKKTRSGLWLCIAKLKSLREKAKIFGNCYKLKDKPLKLSVCDDFGGRSKQSKSKKQQVNSADSNQSMIPVESASSEGSR